MTLTRRQLRLIGAFAVLNVLLAVAGWMALIGPQQSNAANAAAQQQLVQTELATLTTTSSQGPTKQPAIHTSDLYALDTALPAQMDEPDLLFELNRLAAAYDVQLIGISPQPATAMPAGYTIQPINLSVNGTYYNLTGFLRGLRTLVSERNGRLVANGPLFAVNSVGLNPGSAADQTDKAGEVATVGLSAFYYGVTGGAAAPVSTSTTDTTTTTGS